MVIYMSLPWSVSCILELLVTDELFVLLLHLFYFIIRSLFMVSSALVVATSGAGYVLGSGSIVDIAGLCYTCTGTMMVAASANTFNQVLACFFGVAFSIGRMVNQTNVHCVHILEILVFIVTQSHTSISVFEKSF